MTSHPASGYSEGDFVPEHRPGTGYRLRTEAASFRILEMDHGSCVIASEGQYSLRGYADIYDGPRHILHCLLVLTEPDGDTLRCTFKRSTPVRTAPPADFVLPSGTDTDPPR